MAAAAAAVMRRRRHATRFKKRKSKREAAAGYDVRRGMRATARAHAESLKRVLLEVAAGSSMAYSECCKVDHDGLHALACTTP